MTDVTSSSVVRWEEGRLVLPNGDSLEVTARGNGGASVRWLPHEPAIELRGGGVDGDGGVDQAQDDNTIELAILHSIKAPQHIWLPHLAPEANNVIGDAVFRSPAILLADATIALALIPDVDDVAAASSQGGLARAWLDYDHPRSTIVFAAGAYREDGHVFYAREPLKNRLDQSIALRLHVVASSRSEDLANPYGMAARWMWKRWGHLGHERSAAKKQPLARLMDHVVRWAFSTEEGWGESVWQTAKLDASIDNRFDNRSDKESEKKRELAAPVFIVDVTRHPSVPLEQRQWREPRSIWNQAWFSTQRCANGLLRYARQIKSADLEDRAYKMTEVALAAPQHDGLFPAVLIANDADEWRWINSNRRPPSASDTACHILDAAFTCRMLLEWYELTRDERAREYVRSFADRLVALQRPSGAFPGWVERDGSVPSELAESPESAVSASLLFDLASSTSQQGQGQEKKAADSYREAALASLDFLTEVTRVGRWEDFETYCSCAPWGRELIGRRVERNGVYKQNTLSIAWCAEAFLHAWRSTRNESFLQQARRCVDELSLYQAVWDPPWLPAPAHGGFGVMNADCEWNDARQSLFAPLFLDLGREMNDRELVERGVSAVRASFSMLYCPENAALARAYEKRHPFFGPESYGFMMENQGHSGTDPIGTFTIFSWGNGSALATAAMVRDRFSEVVAECGLE